MDISKLKSPIKNSKHNYTIETHSIGMTHKHEIHQPLSCNKGPSHKRLQEYIQLIRSTIYQNNIPNKKTKYSIYANLG